MMTVQENILRYDRFNTVNHNQHLNVCNLNTVTCDKTFFYCGNLCISAIMLKRKTTIL